MSYFYSILAQINNSTPSIPAGWSVQSCPVGDWQYIAYGNGTFVAIYSSTTSGIMRSTDGKNWSITFQNKKFRFLVFYGNKFIVHCDAENNNVSNKLYQSTDGITWTLLKDLSTLSPAPIVGGLAVCQRLVIIPTITGTGYYYDLDYNKFYNANFPSNMQITDMMYYGANGNKYDLALDKFGKIAVTSNLFNSWSTITGSAPGTGTYNKLLKDASVGPIAIGSTFEYISINVDSLSAITRSKPEANFDFAVSVDNPSLDKLFICGTSQPDSYPELSKQISIFNNINDTFTNLTFPTDKVKFYTAGAFGDNKVVIVGAKNNNATEQTVLLLEL